MNEVGLFSSSHAGFSWQPGHAIGRPGHASTIDKGTLFD